MLLSVKAFLWSLPGNAHCEIIPSISDCLPVIGELCIVLACICIYMLTVDSRPSNVVEVVDFLFSSLNTQMSVCL